MTSTTQTFNQEISPHETDPRRHYVEQTLAELEDLALARYVPQTGEPMLSGDELLCRGLAVNLTSDSTTIQAASHAMSRLKYAPDRLSADKTGTFAASLDNAARVLVNETADLVFRYAQLWIFSGASGQDMDRRLVRQAREQLPSFTQEQVTLIKSALADVWAAGEADINSGAQYALVNSLFPGQTKADRVLHPEGYSAREARFGGTMFRLGDHNKSDEQGGWAATAGVPVQGQPHGSQAETILPLTSEIPIPLNAPWLSPVEVATHYGGNSEGMSLLRVLADARGTQLAGIFVEPPAKGKHAAEPSKSPVVELIRFVADPDGRTVPDVARPMPLRGGRIVPLRAITGIDDGSSIRFDPGSGSVIINTGHTNSIEVWGPAPQKAA